MTRLKQLAIEAAWIAFLVALVWLVMSALHPAKAQQICDLQGTCYGGQVYHMDPAHPNRETPPPAPQYHRPTPQPDRVCHLARMRTDPFSLPTIVELCSMSAEEEQAIRDRTNMAPTTLTAPYGVPPW